MANKTQHILQPLPGYEPEVGRSLWALEDTRQRTKRALEDFDEEWLDYEAPFSGLSIGTILYHIAAVEINWLHADVLEGQLFPSQIEAMFLYDVRDLHGSLSWVAGENLESHLNRLDVVREHFLNAFKEISFEEFRRPRALEEYVVTPEWVIHHLVQHETEHSAQISYIRKIIEGINSI